MNGWRHPALWAIIVGLAIAIRSLFGWGPVWVEPILWGLAFAVFAVWAAIWVRYRTFGPAIWLGIFLTIWTPLSQGVLFGTYAANNPGLGDEATGFLMFWSGLLIGAVYSVLLAAAATGLARITRRGDVVAPAA